MKEGREIYKNTELYRKLIIFWKEKVMVYITLICAAGMSTSLLVSKMREVAKKEKIDAEIVAMSESAFSRYKIRLMYFYLGRRLKVCSTNLKKNMNQKE